MSTMNQQWRLAARPHGLFEESDFQWHEEPVPALKDGEVLVRNVYLSLDPTNKVWATMDSYMPAVPLGDVMRGFALGVVEESKNPAFAAGDVVQGLLGWQTYVISDGKGFAKLPKGTPMLASMGVLGHIGMTAYFGLLDIGKAKEGETLVVSAAAGAVGSLAGQIGKIKGCRVIGIAGGAEKCRWITEDLGFDAAIDYKNESVGDGLTRHAPNGIDVYFENVGGKILEAVLARIRLHARIAVCGMISQYTLTAPEPGPSNLGMLVSRRARMEGFLVSDYMPRAAEAIGDLARWLAEGKLKFRTDVVDGLKEAPRAVNMLYRGENMGKLIVKVSAEAS